MQITHRKNVNKLYPSNGCVPIYYTYAFPMNCVLYYKILQWMRSFLVSDSVENRLEYKR